ncbi:AAA family ATPase [Burkholderia sp. JSH-S8]|nr:AAA family ATPase [Burkholderia sp. JSH-S8]
MLKSFGISNFKAFDSFQSFSVAPITLIYGPNSGGKSSIIQSLMLLKQSLASPINQRIRDRSLILKGPYVDLGQSKSIHHKHNTSRAVSFKAAFDGKNNRYPNSLIAGDHEFTVETSFQEASHKGGHAMVELTGVSYGARNLNRTASFESSLERVRKNPGDVSADGGQSYFAKAFQFKTWADVSSLAKFVELLPRVKAQEHQRDLLGWLDGITPESYQPLSVVPRPNLITGKVTFLPHYIRNRASSEQRPGGASDYVSRILNQIARGYSEIFESASYLGPHRNRPRRLYELDHQYQGSVGVSGEYLVEALTEDLYSEGPEAESDGVVKEVNRWLERFEIPYLLSVDSLGDEVVGDIATLKLYDRRADVRVAATDVGFGIGQLLPVIIEGVIAQGSAKTLNRDRLLCVEQPEIHLHPRLQAHVADFFIDTWKKGGCQWIAETHSEALMLRLQRRIRAGDIDAKDVSVVFVNPIPGYGSEILNLRIDDQGEFIDEWPGGFFEETFHEMFPRV